MKPSDIRWNTVEEYYAKMFGKRNRAEKPNPMLENILRTLEENRPAGVDIQAIIDGEECYNSDMPTALEKALEYGLAATMPELIAAKLEADKDHAFWKKYFTTHSEENIGPNLKESERKYYKKSEHLLVVVHGGGLLTPERIRQAYQEGLNEGSAVYTDEEWTNLLKGKLPGGIKLYTLEQVMKGIEKPHRFGVVMPYSMAQQTESGYHQKQPFLDNPLVIARNGGLENLDEYYEKAKHSDGDLGNHHPFQDRDASTPGGRLLVLGNNYDGLYGVIILYGNGRFVGVAPEAPWVRKK